jgi:polyisoprenoid-binding protein YceI
MQSSDRVGSAMSQAMEFATRPEVRTLHFIIDSSASNFTVKAYATGMLSAFAHSPTVAIPDFEGDVNLNPEAPELSSMRLVIHSDSLNVIDDISEKDRREINRRMREEVLESDSFPEIVYQCSKGFASKAGEGQYNVTLEGELTLHGITRPQAVPARISLHADTLRATGEFLVSLSDYEIQQVTAAGGTIKLKDEIKLVFEISARKQM